MWTNRDLDCTIWTPQVPHYKSTSITRCGTNDTILGTYIHFDAKAIGSGSEGAQTSLQEIYKGDMSIDQITVHALQILKQVMEDKLNSVNVEVVQVLIDGACKRLTQDQLQGYIDEINK